MSKLVTFTELYGPNQTDGIPVIAEQVTEHFAIHPAILHRQTSGTTVDAEAKFDGHTWSLAHIPSGLAVFNVCAHNSPSGVGGDPIELDLERAREFLAWLNNIADWSGTTPDVLPVMADFTDDQRRLVDMYFANPNGWLLAKDATAARDDDVPRGPGMTPDELSDALAAAVTPITDGDVAEAGDQ